MDETEPNRQLPVERALKYVPFFAFSNLALAAPAFLISLTVAYFTFVQAEATQKMQIASVWPRVDYDTGNMDDEGQPAISFNATNQGVGPALIGGMQIEYRGKAYLEADTLLDDCCAAGGRRDSLVTRRINGAVVRPGNELSFIELRRTGGDDPVYDRLNSERFKMRVRVCYCSVFEECWIEDSQMFETTQVDQCPVDWTQYGLPPGSPPPQ